jgi:hypothetical protein
VDQDDLMVNLVALRAELDKPAYNGLSNAAAAVAVMAAVITTDRTVPSAEVARLWAWRGILAKAREAGERGASASARELGWRVLDTVAFDALAQINTAVTADKTAFTVVLDTMVTAGLMTAGQRTETLDLVIKARTGREVFGAIDENDVARARAL